jgi:hypothetical protein
MNGKELASLLAAATCSLLGTAETARAADEPAAWNFDTALLMYKENDGRVRDLSAAVNASRTFSDDRVLGLSLTADTLTGASASGATALDRPQTFTSPSGLATYSTAAGRIPLDDTFKDTRIAATGSWTQPLGRLYTASAGLGFSSEYDYRHLGANVSLARDFDRRNRTVSLGLAYSLDDVDPVGGAPLPLSQMLDVGSVGNKAGSKSKDVVDAVLSLSQVVDRDTVVRFNYSYSRSSGYLNDPYKILSVVDGTTGDTVARVPGAAGGPTGVYRFESRPDSRTKQSVYGEVKRNFGGVVLTGSYRYMTDDWGIGSHTVDARLRWPIGRGYIEPQARWYTQTQADFYRVSLVSGQALPQYASADFRLGRFDATTLGLKYGYELSNGSEWNVRLAGYQQSGSTPSSMLIGNQSRRETVSDLKAVILQVGYRFGL